ncbi:MAG: BrnT family toxin [Geminicoccaceae bacterium]|nr:BrnT family toxin [Geminicoccaceae bacterium]
MRFEWDERKRASNARTHGVDFLDMVRVFDGRLVFEYHSPRQGEDRWGTVGIVNDRFYLVVRAAGKGAADHLRLSCR